jgi:putative nucleotidyltransferase with HDIG domain
VAVTILRQISPTVREADVRDARLKIDTSYVAPGMYVAQLDRPWLATPFLFQGFEITDTAELAQLQKYCRYVYVDIKRSSMAAPEIEARLRRATTSRGDKITAADDVKTAPSPTFLQRLATFLLRFDSTGWFGALLGGTHVYQSRTSTHAEAPHAANAYAAATGVLSRLLDSVRDGGTVDVEEVRGAVNPMIDSVLRNPDAMAWLLTLKKRDEYTYNHSIATSVWGVVLGRHLGFDRKSLEILAVGGLLLDIGKTRIPDELLQKKAVLSASESDLMQQHVEIGADLVRNAAGIGQEVVDMIVSHHERHDGSGYPCGLAGADIPVFGRIAGIVDCYDAMITHRSYASAKSAYMAVRELNGEAGKKFQRELVEQFVQALGMFPSGSIVALNTGEVGIVIEQNRVRRLRPKVMLLLDSAKQPLPDQKIVDLRKLPSDEREAGAIWIASGLEPGAHGIDPKDYFL